MIEYRSRRILVWKVNEKFDPSTTAEILLAAKNGADFEKPTVLADGSVENCSGSGDELIKLGLLKMYFRTGDYIPKQLPDARQEARQARAAANRR